MNVVRIGFAIQFQAMVSATAMPIGPSGCSASDFFRNEIHRLVSEVVLAAPTVRACADRLDPGLACSDSSDSRDLSTNECGACWPQASILFQWHWCARRTVDSDIVQSTHSRMTTAKRFCASNLQLKWSFRSRIGEERANVATFLRPFTFTVEQKCAKATRVQMVENGDQEILIEFKCVRKLFAHLPHTVDELQKHRRPIGIGMMIVAVTDAMLKFMTEAEPLFLDEYLETANRAVVRIEQEHCKCRQLGGAVPAIRTVNDDRCAHVFDFVDDANGAGQHAFDMLQPQRALHGRQPLLVVVGRKANLFQFP